MAATYRQRVVRADGRTIDVVQRRAHLSYCFSGCCCGRTERGYAAVPVDTYKAEWLRRKLRHTVHLTKGGCLGPCALANVALLLFDGQALWFHSINTPDLVRALYDYTEAMLDADACLPAPAALAPYQFSGSAWQPRPDGQPVDDYRPRRRASPGPVHDAGACPAPSGRDEPAEERAHRLLAELGEAARVPRKNGELVFEAPWEGRAFGLAVALSEQGVFAWEDFRQLLIAEIAAAEARGGEFRYYDAWLGALERVLAAREVLRDGELNETTFQFEFGERDEVF